MERKHLEYLSIKELYKWHQSREREVERLNAEMKEINEVIAAKEKEAFVPNTKFPHQGVG